MGRITVVGGALPGLAAATRLAKAGHEVTLLEATDTLGGRWTNPAGWEATLALPAAWRDLFRKSGRILDAELATADLAMEPAPAAIHLMPDGKQLRLPAERGAQLAMVRLAYGDGAATAWRDLLLRHDATWQRLRPLGLEGDEPLNRARWRALDPRRTLADEAAALGPLGPLVTQLAWPYDPATVPAWEAARLCVDRTFGRWRVLRDGLPVAGSELVALLAARARRRVDVVTGEAVADVRSLPGVVVDTTGPWHGLVRRPVLLRPALGPTVITEAAERELPEVIDHAARTVSHSVRIAGQWVRVKHDHAAAAPDPGLGVAWRGASSWRRRPAIGGRDGIVRAHAASRGGALPWQQLLTGAVASYAAHDATGGCSIRPVDDPRKQA